MTDQIRAALSADGSAGPENREPASVVGEPSDAELLELMHQSMRDDLAEVSRLAALKAGTDPGVFRVTLNYDVARFARAVLARWGHQPAPPAEGEVGELVAWLRMQGEAQKPGPNSLLSDRTKNEQQTAGTKLIRAADLLEGAQ